MTDLSMFEQDNNFTYEEELPTLTEEDTFKIDDTLISRERRASQSEEQTSYIINNIINSLGLKDLSADRIIKLLTLYKTLETESLKKLFEDLRTRGSICLDSSATYGTKVKKDFHTQFCIDFTENWERIMFDSRFKLTMTEIKIMHFVKNRMKSGNVFTLTQKTISQETGIDQSNVSRTFSSLVKKGILKKDEGNSYFFNSNLSVKGYSSSQNSERKQAFLDKKSEPLSIMDSYCDDDVIKKNIEDYRIFRQLQIKRDMREREEKTFSE